MSTLKVLYHGQCFDGFSSAAVFSRFFREQVDKGAALVVQGMRHGSPNPVDTALFDRDVHAIVDFRYSSSPRLDWWFDHHRSAFVTPDERAHFESARSPRHFWDAKAPSCTSYLVRTVAERFGFDASPLSDLVRWADIIDTANFKDARTAVELEEPALQLMSVLEHLEDGPLANQVIAGLAEGDVQGVAGLPAIQALFAPILAQHRKSLELVRSHAVSRDDVVFVDLTTCGHIVYNKFVPYYLYPDATYVVAVTQSDGRVKISVGSNPWLPERRRHDISEICERYGGGGHPVVGGITIPGGTAAHAVGISRDIVATLLS